MGFNPRDFMTVQQAVQQSQQSQAAPPPPSGGWSPQYAGRDAYSTTVMPETGAPGPSHSLYGNRNYVSLDTANEVAKLGGRVLQANMAQGPTRTNAAQYAIDFGVPGSDPLNAGQLASRYDTNDPNRDKYWDMAGTKERSLRDELNHAARYNPTAAKRDPSSFEGPSNNPQYQWHTPQGAANYLGKPMGVPGSRPQQAAPQTLQMNMPRTGMPAQRSNLYGGRSMAPRSSPYGAMNRTAAAPSPSSPRASAPVISAYRAPGTRTF